MTCEWCLKPIIEGGPESRSWTTACCGDHAYHVDCFNTMNDEAETLDEEPCD